MQGEAQDGVMADHSLTHLSLSHVWLWSKVGDVLTLSQPLGYSSEVEMAQTVHQNSVW